MPTTARFPSTLNCYQNLSEEQRRAVTTTDGPVLIVAGPGSGKTRVIIQRIAYLIDHLNADPRRIMAVTFTNRAANEMVDRLSATVRPDQAKAATVSTFHRLCGRLNHALASRVGLNDHYSIYDRDDQLGVVKRAMELADIDSAWCGVRPSHILSRISGAKSRLMGPEDFARSVHESGAETALQDEAAALAYPHYQRELQQANALDFDDIILRAIHILQTSETARRAAQNRYRYVMVDEYQDTNVAQNVLTDLLAGDSPNLCVVGDPNQSIYGWRHADIANILTFEEYGGLYEDGSVWCEVDLDVVFSARIARWWK